MTVRPGRGIRCRGNAKSQHFILIPLLKSIVHHAPFFFARRNASSNSATTSGEHPLARAIASPFANAAARAGNNICRMIGSWPRVYLENGVFRPITLLLVLYLLGNSVLSFFNESLVAKVPQPLTM